MRAGYNDIQFRKNVVLIIQSTVCHDVDFTSSENSYASKFCFCFTNRVNVLQQSLDRESIRLRARSTVIGHGDGVKTSCLRK